MNSLAIGALVGTALVSTPVWLVLLRWAKREEQLAARLASLRWTGEAEKDAVTEEVSSRATQVLASVGRLLTGSGLLSAKTLADLEQTLIAAGFRGRNALLIFVGAKAGLLTVLPLLVLLMVESTGFGYSKRGFLLAVAAVIGLLGPDFIVKRIRKRYLKKVSQGLPDALDLLVICAEAGLGLEVAVERVAVEITAAHPAVGNEFSLTSSELRILSDRRVALMNLSSRTRLEPLTRLATTLVQTLKYGTPLIQALRSLAVELREEQMTVFEARAARLPVLLTIPMILFILPPLFVVIGGPAIIQAVKVFR